MCPNKNTCLGDLLFKELSNSELFNGYLSLSFSERKDNMNSVIRYIRDSVREGTKGFCARSAKQIMELMINLFAKNMMKQVYMLKGFLS